MEVKITHKAAMWAIALAGVVLLYLSAVWFSESNSRMGIGMFIMGVAALSSAYLHRGTMGKSGERR